MTRVVKFASLADVAYSGPMTRLIGPTSRQAWIYQHFTDRILNGDLKASDDLPGIGTLAKEWGVSKTTAQRALVQLRDERWIVTRPGKASIVAPTIPDREALRPAQTPRDHA